MDNPVIGVAGMTHLGLNSAVASAERGFDVVCFDPDRGRIDPLKAGILPIVEPDLPELVEKNAARLIFTSDRAALSTCDVCYVAPDVPTNDLGESDLNSIKSLIAIVDPALRNDAVMVVLSQVPPGFTHSLSRPIATRYYQVETLIFGQAIDRALNPERLIVGCADPKKPLPDVMARYLEAFGCPILQMGYGSAELCKISINMCLVASVVTANTIAELCEAIGADWSEIVPALRLDRRIGPYSYIAAGLGIAGGNLERDLASFVRMGSAYGTDVGVVRAWQTSSAHRRYWALRKLHESVLLGSNVPTIGLLGLAYKEDTDSVKNSPSVALAKALGACQINAYDPVVTADPEWHPSLFQVDNAHAATKGADALVIMTPWPEFRDLKVVNLAAAMSGTTVIDPFAILDETEAREAGLDYHRLGAA